MYGCICQAVTVSEVREVTEAGTRDFDEVVDRFSLGGEDSCGACLVVLERLLAEIVPVELGSTRKECVTDCHQCPLRVACARGLMQGGIE